MLLIGSFVLLLASILFAGSLLPALTTPQQTAATSTPSQDTTPPTLTVPIGIVHDPFGGTFDGIPVEEAINYSVKAQDNVDGSATLDEFNMLIQDNIGGSITISCSPATSSFLPLGDHTVTCSATDAAGNMATASFTATVRTLLETPELPDEPRELSTGPGLLDTPELPDEPRELSTGDTTPPTLTVPDNIVVEANVQEPSDTEDAQLLAGAEDNVDGQALLYENSFIKQDNVGGLIDISCNPASISNLPIGDHTVTCSATDAAGNQATPKSFPVTVTALETPELPEFGRPGELNTQDQNAIQDQQSLQTLQAQDPATTAGTTDTTPPTVDVPDDLVLQTNGTRALLVYRVTAQDNVDGSATLDEDGGLQHDTVGDIMLIYCPIYWSQSFLSLGNYSITCTATDSSGNEGNATFTVAIVNPNCPAGSAPGTACTTDTIAPTLTVPNDMTLETNGTTALLKYPVTAQDNVDGSATLEDTGILIQDNVGGDIEIICTPKSDIILPIGEHPVQCSAIDAAGITSPQAMFKVSIIKNPDTPVGPTPTPAAGGITASLTANPATYNGPCPATIQFSGTITDNVGNRDVYYRFIRSDTRASPVEIIHFNQPGSQTVSHTWTFPYPDIPTFQEWVAIEILEVNVDGTSTVQLQSNQAQFQITCTPSTGGAAPGSPTSVDGITVSANPTIHNGPCPANIQVSGTITDNVGNRDVTYRFIFPATGGSTSEQVIHFNQPGSQMVTLTESDFNGRPIQGSVAIEILQPVQLQSNQAQFQITCTPAAGAPAGGPDTTKPTLTKSGGGEINYDVDNTALVDYQVTAQDSVDGTATLDINNMLSQDNVGGSITISCNPASPSKLPIGDHRVDCTATDAAGNPGTLSFTISIPRPTTPVGPTLQAAEDEDTAAGAAADGEEEEDTTAPPATTDDDDAGAGGGGGSADGTDDDSTTGGAGTGGGTGATSDADDDDDSSAGGTDGTDNTEPQ